jgi:hypothetical protein
MPRHSDCEAGYPLRDLPITEGRSQELHPSGSLSGGGDAAQIEAVAEGNMSAQRVHHKWPDGPEVLGKTTPMDVMSRIASGILVLMPMIFIGLFPLLCFA